MTRERGSAGTLVLPARRRASAGPPRPPEPPDGGGGGDGDRGGDDAPVPPGGSGEDVPLFGLVLALAGIATLFAVLLVAWLFLRRQEPDATRDSPLLPPRPLWISTSFLAASSLALERARRLGRGDRADGARRGTRWLLASLALGLAFLAAQAILWRHFLAAGLFPSSGAYGASFFALTGLHGAHVVGGVVWLARASLRALTARLATDSLRLVAIYWHFMGCLWLVLFAALYFVG